jgi:catechol 2,3-dioxygenase
MGQIETAAARANRPPAIRYRPRRVGHLNLWVSNWRASIDFYRTVCGFTENGRESKLGAGFLSNGNTHHDLGIVNVQSAAAKIARAGHLKLLPDNYGKVPGLNHFGWEMDTETDLVAAVERARAADFTIHRYTDQGNSYSTYVFDQDGVVHQFYADKQKDWRALYKGFELDFHSNPPWEPGKKPPSTARNYWVDPPISRNEHAPLHPIRVTHAVLLSNDIERTKDFYTEVAGLDVAYAAPDNSVYYLAGSAAVTDVVLFKAGPGRLAGMHHGAFECSVDEDMGLAEAELARRGIPVAASIDNANKRSVFVRDPDGMLLEFYVRRSTARSGFKDDGSERAVLAA